MPDDSPQPRSASQRRGVWWRNLRPREAVILVATALFEKAVLVPISAFIEVIKSLLVFFGVPLAIALLAFYPMSWEVWLYVAVLATALSVHFGLIKPVATWVIRRLSLDAVAHRLVRRQAETMDPAADRRD